MGAAAASSQTNQSTQETDSIEQAQEAKRLMIEANITALKQIGFQEKANAHLNEEAKQKESQERFDVPVYIEQKN